MIKLGIVMDPISSINIKKDSSFAMLLEAQRRGWELYYIEIIDLYIKNGKGMASMRQVKVMDDHRNWYHLSNEKELPLDDLDVILMRKDPPFNTEFIYATYILELAERQGTLVVNKPQSLRDCNEKLFTVWFPEFTPHTLVTRKKEKILEFYQNYKDIILKPLDRMGGASIFRINKDDPNLSVIIETLTHNGQHFCMAQNFLPAISEGDRRVLVVNGETVPYCLVRTPAQGEIRANLTAGGHAKAKLLNKSDWNIASALSPRLKEKGLIFVGLDIIGDRLTEINVTSPTCIREIEEVFPISITGMLMNSIENIISKKNRHG